MCENHSKSLIWRWERNWDRNLLSLFAIAQRLGFEPSPIGCCCGGENSQLLLHRDQNRIKLAITRGGGFGSFRPLLCLISGGPLNGGRSRTGPRWGRFKRSRPYVFGNCKFQNSFEVSLSCYRRATGFAVPEFRCSRGCMWTRPGKDASIHELAIGRWCIGGRDSSEADPESIRREHQARPPQDIEHHRGIKRPESNS